MVGFPAKLTSVYFVLSISLAKKKICKIEHLLDTLVPSETASRAFHPLRSGPRTFPFLTSKNEGRLHVLKVLNPKKEKTRSLKRSLGYVHIGLFFY